MSPTLSSWLQEFTGPGVPGTFLGSEIITGLEFCILRLMMELTGEVFQPLGRAKLIGVYASGNTWCLSSVAAPRHHDPDGLGLKPPYGVARNFFEPPGIEEAVRFLQRHQEDATLTFGKPLAYAGQSWTGDSGHLVRAVTWGFEVRVHR